MRAKIIGKRGSFIVSDKEFKIEKYRVGDFTNETGNITKIQLMPDKPKKKTQKKKTSFLGTNLKMPNFRL